MTSVAMSLPEIARAAGIHLKDAKRYLKLGLLQARRPGDARPRESAFHQEHIDRLRFIRDALDVNFSVENIAALVGANAKPTCSDIYALAMRRVDELRQEPGQDPLAAAVLEQLANSCARSNSTTDCALLTVLRTGHKAQGAQKE